MLENSYNIGTIRTKHPYGGIVSDNGWSGSKGNIDGGKHPHRIESQPYIRNCYCLNSTAEKGLVKNTKDSLEPISLSEGGMKSDDFLNNLNNQSTEALKGNVYWKRQDDINSGYQYLI